ncbi:MAG: hypothetical protein NVV83_10380 [Afipia sp.]|nr:hypothetical protein [Afipia sp.]
MKDIYGTVSPAVLIGAATLDADNTPVGVSIADFESALIEIAVGAGGITFTGTNKIEFKLTHSDDNSTYEAVAQRDIAGATVTAGGIIKSLIAAHAAADVTKVGYVGGRPWLKLLADFGGTHAAGTPISATVIRANPHLGPVA